MAIVAALLPGDEVSTADGRTAVFVVETGHPLWPTQRLVIWRLEDTRNGAGRSHADQAGNP
jgi:hypothetical protein